MGFESKDFGSEGKRSSATPFDIQAIEGTFKAMEGRTQARLLLLAEQERNPGSNIDFMNPENVSHEVRQSAGLQWVTGDDSAAFRDLVEDSANSTRDLNPEEEQGLRALLADIRNRKDKRH